ncbi:MAG: pentapeptide repeat-containing protein [Planctomycetota bacterium]
MPHRGHVELAERGAKAVSEWQRLHPTEILDLTSASLCYVDLSGADLTRANLRGAKLGSARLMSADLSGVNLEAAELVVADLRGCKLERANLQRADLGKANLAFANLGGARLAGADLRSSILVEANLSRADLVGADLRGADLTGVNFSTPNGASSARIKGALLDGIRYGPSASRRIGVLELATVRDLDEASWKGLHVYLVDAFQEAVNEGGAAAGQFSGVVRTALERIAALRKLFDSESSTPEPVVELVTLIRSELMRDLKKNPKAIRDIGTRQFEELIAEILASYGWEVQLTPKTRDGGYDIFAIQKDVSGVRANWIIECKRYAEHRKVGVDIVRSLYGVKTDMRVGNAMLATTSDFTKGVHDFKASKYDLDLRNYEAVLEWVNTYKPKPGGRIEVRDHRLWVPGDDD